MKELKRIMIIWFALGLASGHAQSLHTAISTQAKITDRINATALMSRGSYDRFKGTSKTTLSLSVNYIFSPHLSVAAGSSLVVSHTQEKALSSGLSRPSFWQPRWRSFISVSPRVSLHGFNAFYRSRIQMLVKGDKSLRLIPSGDPDLIEGATTFTWVHRLYAEHPFHRLTPYISYDLFNSIDYKFKVTQYQIALGTYYFLTPKNRFGFFTRKIFYPDSNVPPTGSMLIGLTYQYRFVI